MSTDKIRFYELAKEFNAKPKDLHAKVRRLGFSLKSHMSTLDPAQARAIRNALGAPERTEAVTPQPTVRKRVETPQPKVLRNEDGVIVGTTRRSEPKILGFIKVAPRPSKAKKGVVAKAVKAKAAEPGRASRRKDRVQRKMQKNFRNESRARANRRGRRARVSHTKPRKAENRVLEVNGSILVSELAHVLSKTASQVVRAAYRLGIKGLRPNHRIDVATASTLASEFDWRVDDTSFDESALLRRTSTAASLPRAPVVTVMGHVDHGKTSLLDAIRDTRVAQREAGGITQHIGAYRVQHESGDLVFLDTPGHQAFNAMRGRGAQVTDIVVLVVAADDGVMPTTIEAIEHAREAGVPVVVAVTKCDLDSANPGRAKQQLMEHQLIGEEFGGDTLIVEVSAKQGVGIDALLQTLLLQAELLELRAPVAGRARGVVLESRVRKGHGPTCTVLVQAGTLKVGDVIVAGQRWGKVRRLLDEDRKPVESAGPSTPVTVVGLDAPPSTGRPAIVVEDDEAAKRVIAHREERRRQAMPGNNVLSIERFLRRRNVSVVPVVIKADVNGSLEAVEEVLDAIDVDGVELDVVATGLGPITEGDVKTASAAGATIVGFAVKAGSRAVSAARRESVEIETSRVIYELADAVEARMTDLLEPVLEERRRGTVEVRATFDIRKVGRVAGGRVVEGELTRDARVRVVRDGAVVHEGELASLRMHKDDVARVGNGRECGFAIRGFDDLREGDRVEAYALEAVSRHG